jgi:hypothetical protein
MKIYLVLMTILLTILGLLSMFPALMAPLMFDAPGSTSDPVMLTLFAAVFSMPFVCGGAANVAWFLWDTHPKLSCLVVLSPVVNIIVVAAIFIGEQFA